MISFPQFVYVIFCLASNYLTHVHRNITSGHVRFGPWPCCHALALVLLVASLAFWVLCDFGSLCGDRQSLYTATHKGRFCAALFLFWLLCRSFIHVLPILFRFTLFAFAVLFVCFLRGSGSQSLLVFARYAGVRNSSVRSYSAGQRTDSTHINFPLFAVCAPRFNPTQYCFRPWGSERRSGFRS